MSLFTIGVARGAAQTTPPAPPDQPARGLFGSSSTRQSLVLTGSIYGGYDDNVLADQQGAVDSSTGQGGGLAGGELALAYGKQGRRVDFGLSGRTSGRYYPDGDLVTSSTSYGMGAALAARLSRYTRLNVTQNLSYVPYYQLDLFPGLEPPALGGPPPSNLDYVVSQESGWQADTVASLERQIGPRASVRFLGSVYRSDFGTATPEISDNVLTTYSAGGQYLRSLTQEVGLRLGYTYRQGNYGARGVELRQVEDHEVDIGIDYRRALTRSGRTTVGFSTGSSIVNAESERHFRFIGHGNLSHQMGRSWVASLRYGRDVGFVGNFGTPLYSDNLSLGLNGLIGPRFALSFSGGLSSGDVGFSPETRSEFSTYTAAASAQYAVNAYLAGYVQYSYFDYDFPTAGLLLPVNGRLSRDGVRVGLSVTLPLVR